LNGEQRSRELRGGEGGSHFGFKPPTIFICGDTAYRWYLTGRDLSGNSAPLFSME
jgi:hypothetical protein